ncbi:MAG TPA: bacteriocin [Flavobacteriales bacterium]|jgi:bacteriocin-like protein|nr:bacteriocin [Flavobacteriales bacterium]
MKVGDFVIVYEKRACGGISNRSTGLVLAKDDSQIRTPRWLVRWTPAANIPGTEMKMKESLTYGHGIVPICELTDEQLEHVIGGMSTAKFSEWRCKLLNEGLLK